MKSLLALVLSAAAVLVLSAWPAWGGPAYEIRVDGLACPFCAYGVEKELSSLEGVASLETRIDDGVVVVTMEDGTALDEQTAREAVEAAGFTFDGLEQVGSDAAAGDE